MRSLLLPLAAACSLLAPSARAASFDCAKASTPTEKAICRVPAVSELDARLGAVFKAALGRDPAGREALTASQRGWLAWRNRTCRAAADCLERALRDRIAALEADPAAASAPLCRALAERYAAWRRRTGSAGAAGGGRGLLALKDVAGSGLTVAKPVATVTGAAELEAWARARQPPLTLPQDAVASFSPEDSIDVERLPGVEYYAASAIQGSAHCFLGAYFAVEAGKARVDPGPASWTTLSSDGGDCGVRRAFGTVDGVPVALQEGPGSTLMESSFSLTPWRRDRFGPSCAAVLRFAPRFSPTEFANDWDETCAGPRCAALRSAALALVTEVQADPRGALRRALDAVTPEQRSAFERGAAASKDKGKAAAARSPDAPTDQEPLTLPLVVEGVPYRVAVGHVTIGWRTFPDWRVTFDRLPGGERTASVAVGMGWGELLGTTVW